MLAGLLLTSALPMPPSPLPAIARIRFDAEAQTATVTMSDGRALSTPTTSPHPWTALSSAEADLATRELTMRLRTGECLVVELGTGGETDVPAPDRPVVYLDQRHWITLAQRLHSPDEVAERDREPAARLIELARSKLIALPLSSANLWEIAPTGPHRRDVALTMVELSRGWQLRDPVSVRGQELKQSMSGHSPVRAEAVLTLEPGAIFNADVRSVEMAGAPAEWNVLFDRITNAEASFASILEDDPPGEAEFRRAVAANWAVPHQQLAKHLRDAGTPRKQIRLAAYGRLLGDLRTEIARAAIAAGLSPQQNAAWLAQADEALESMPYVRTLHEVLFSRLSNADDHWSGNDLADSQFLCCAAAYADFVATERKFGDYLQRARRRYTDNAVTEVRLQSLVEKLAAVGIG